MLEIIEKAVDEPEIPVMMTVPEAAKESGFGKDIIYRWLKTGKLPAVKSGRKFYISRKNFCRFLNGEDLSNV